MSIVGKSQANSQIKFFWTTLILQGGILIFSFLFLRYEENNDKENPLRNYPMIIDIHMMLFGGFGFLMTFLKRFGYSAVGMTMFITCIVTEWSIILNGFTKMNEDYSIKLSFEGILEGGLSAAATLISFGAVLGKLNPFQLLVMGIVESIFFVLNSYIGYRILGAIDIGGAIFIHIFGAFFGLAVSFAGRKRRVSKSDFVEGSCYTSDIFAMIGTVLLWVYWPSFNAVLALEGAPAHRAVMNTYLSLLGSTISTFTVSAFFDGGRFDMVDVQNATLSGGVVVGAVADLMLQPYGAFIAGSCIGVISTFGYRWLQNKLLKHIGLHDTCGVHNLHGIPGVTSGLLSALLCYMASESIYGKKDYYAIFPKVVPTKGPEFTILSSEVPGLEPGSGRSISTQALLQLLAVGMTLTISIIAGLTTGLILNVKSLFNPLEDHQLFDDEYFWNLPDEQAGHYSANYLNTPSDKDRYPSALSEIDRKRRVNSVVPLE